MSSQTTSLPRDANRVTTLGGVSSSDGSTPVAIYANPVTHRLLVSTGGGATDITVGVTTVTGGTDTRVLFDNAGVLGEYAISGTGSVAMTNSPTFVTPVLGVASATSINKVAFTAPSSGATLTIADGKTLTVSNILTFTGTDSSSVAFGTGGTVLYTSSTVPLTVGTTTIASGTNTRILYDNSGVLGEYTLTGSGTVVAMQTSPALITPALGVATATTLAIGGATIGSNGLAITGHVLVEGVTSTGATGTGKFVFDGTPTLVTPILGVATATSLNGNTFTTGTYTLTGVAGKTLTFNKSLTLDGTDSTTMTFPSTSASVARTDAAQTFTGTQTFSQIVTTNNAIAASSNAATVPITSRISTVTNSSAATLTITITTTSAVDGMLVMVRILDFSGVAQTITWVNTENSTVTAPTTSNGSTTLPLTVGFQYNTNTTKWRCIAVA